DLDLLASDNVVEQAEDPRLDLRGGQFSGHAVILLVFQRPRHCGGRRSIAARAPSRASSVSLATLRMVSPKRMASTIERCCERTATSLIARWARGAART